jgi:hypothetical protein
MRGLGRFRIIRNLGAHLYRLPKCHVYRDLLGQLDVHKSIFQGLDVDDNVANLKRNGYALGVDLPQHSMLTGIPRRDSHRTILTRYGEH